MRRCPNCGRGEHAPDPICRGNQTPPAAAQEPAWEPVRPADLDASWGADPQHDACALGQALLQVIDLARERADGHFAVFGFTTNVRAALGTPDLTATDLEPYFQVRAAPVAPTVFEALERLLQEPVRFSELDADGERARFDQELANTISAAGGTRLPPPAAALRHLLWSLDWEMAHLDDDIEAISDRTVRDWINLRVGRVRGLVGDALAVSHD